MPMPAAAAPHMPHMASAPAPVIEEQPSFLRGLLWIVALSGIMGGVVLGITQCAQSITPAGTKKAEVSAPVVKPAA